MVENEENVNETPEDPVAEQAEAPEEQPVEEAPVEEAPVEETPAEEAPAVAPPAAAAEPSEPEVQVPPKERRKAARSRHTGEARPPRSAEERAQERAELRAVKARHRRAYRVKERERRRSEPRAEAPAPEPREAGNLKVRQGVVVSDRANKTITVRIDIARPHRMYKKIVRTSSTLHVHDESNEAHVGDTVRVVESRPLSRTKRWRLMEVVERAR
jgi:small subunit ribosomal protein S17